MSKFLIQEPLILASGSSIRQKLLQSLGLNFKSIPAHCDEEQIKANFIGTNWIELGLLLANQKALEISTQYPDHYVIGADQLCIINNQILNKPLNHSTAIQHLTLLSGQTHQQIACVCIAHNQQIIWQQAEIANLQMHTLNKDSIEAYLHTEQPYQSCGAYQYETLGKWLFKYVEGQEDTILGLPLLPLTKALTTLKIVTF